MMRARVLAIALALVPTACIRAAPPEPALAYPLRIVSLDYCADQYVLALAPRERILAVSPDAGAEFSYMRQQASGLRRVRPNGEDVLALKPDLIVRAYGGGPNAAALYARAGVPVLDVPWTDDLASVRAALLTMADGLNEPARGAAMAAEMDARLARLAPSDGARALYVTPGGYTSGPGTLMHEMIVASGLTNMEAEPGYRPVPLERLAQDEPDVVARGFAEQFSTYVDVWSAARHPVLKARTRTARAIALDGAWVACGGWFVVDAIDALAAR
jgi:iron complex transport system substrate-binding protein